MSAAAAQALLTEILSILVGGIQSIATGVGAGLSTLATNIMLTGTGENQTLSVFGVFIVIFGAVGLAIGLCRFVLRFLTSWGN